MLLDYDRRSDPTGTAEDELYAALGELPDTRVVMSRSDGSRHRLYRANGASYISAATLIPRFEIKHRGGYRVGVGSIHPDTGEPYVYDAVTVRAANVSCRCGHVVRIGGDLFVNGAARRSADCERSTAVLYAPSEGSDGLEVIAAAGVLHALVGGRATTEAALVERVLREGSARVVADFGREAVAFPFAGFRSSAVLPARDAAGPVRGVLVVLHPRPDAYRLEELAALQPLARFLSIALGIPEHNVRVRGSKVRPVT